MKDNLSLAFFLIGVAIATLGAFFFYCSNNAARKKRLLPWYAILLVVVFGLLLAIQNFPLPLGLPMITLVVFLNAKFAKFCNHCGYAILRREWWLKLEYCPRCRMKLNDGDETKPHGS